MCNKIIFITCINPAGQCQLNIIFVFNHDKQTIFYALDSITLKEE